MTPVTNRRTEGAVTNRVKIFIVRDVVITVPKKEVRICLPF